MTNGDKRLVLTCYITFVNSIMYIYKKNCVIIRHHFADNHLHRCSEIERILVSNKDKKLHLSLVFLPEYMLTEHPVYCNSYDRNSGIKIFSIEFKA